MSTIQIDTGKAERRTLRFENFGQLWAEVERIAAAERARRLGHRGNWDAGQMFNHLAAWAEYPFDGYPPQLNPPWFIKLILRTRKRKYLHGGLPAGIKIPGVEGGTAATERAGLDDGMARLKKAWARLEAQAPTAPNPIFGPLTHEEWKAINLRHAELHLGFLHPQ